MDRSVFDKTPQPRSKRQAAATVRDGEDSKRTLIMTLVAVGAGAFGLWAFATGGGSRDAHGKIYATPSECASDGALSKANCDAEWKRSFALHANYAPTYDSMRSCEASHGQGKCLAATMASDTARRGLFIPVMSGYVMGRLTSGGYQSAPLYKLKADERHKHRMTVAPEPIRDAQGRSLSAFVWMSRTTKPVAAAGRSLWGGAQPGLGERQTPAQRVRAANAASAAAKVTGDAAKRGGFGGATKAASAGG